MAKNAISRLIAKPARDICLSLADNSTFSRSAVKLFELDSGSLRDPHPVAARMTAQFMQQNASLFERLNVNVKREYDGRDVYLTLQSGNTVGAVPLISPSSNRFELGLNIQPRFPWAGIGPMLSQMGWRIVPTPLRLPLLNQSERRVPPWVLSAMVIQRLQELLKTNRRQFSIQDQELQAPRGRVNWAAYASHSLPRARFNALPCSYPELEADKVFRGVIRFTLEKQVASLSTQLSMGSFVLRLMQAAQTLLNPLQDTPSLRPNPSLLQLWMKSPLRSEAFLNGIEAVGWTLDERGLAGTSDLEGIPWQLPMDAFFEAWIETVFQSLAKSTNASLKVGRKNETTVPIQWKYSSGLSLRSLRPDLSLSWQDTTLLVDAKYKRHYEEWQRNSSGSYGEDLKNAHRLDLHQILAYANLAPSRRVITCLAYPCAYSTWLSLKDRNRNIHQATINRGDKQIEIWLSAFPMGRPLDEVVAPLQELLREPSH
jgi:hypothetical protein